MWLFITHKASSTLTVCFESSFPLFLYSNKFCIKIYLVWSCTLVTYCYGETFLLCHNIFHSKKIMRTHTTSAGTKLVGMDTRFDTFAAAARGYHNYVRARRKVAWRGHFRCFFHLGSLLSWREPKEVAYCNVPATCYNINAPLNLCATFKHKMPGHYRRVTYQGEHASR